MRTLVRWDPFAELAGLSRVLDRANWAVPTGHIRRFDLTPAVDLSETDNEVVVKASLPGVKPEDVDISVNGGKKSDDKTEGENFYRREIRYGAFSRSIPLPAAVDQDKAEAAFTDGVLTVTLPKSAEAKPKQIKIMSS